MLEDTLDNIHIYIYGDYTCEYISHAISININVPQQKIIMCITRITTLYQMYFICLLSTTVKRQAQL